jgi:hydroxymethylpyrimidine pyrophosphatase-like HAD family hydrolase
MKKLIVFDLDGTLAESRTKFFRYTGTWKMAYPGTTPETEATRKLLTKKD